MSSPATWSSSHRVGARPSLWDVPVALWGYGLLRALAFVAPSWTNDGHIGLGVLPVVVLYVLVLRRSRTAYNVLVGLDIFSHVMLLTTWFDLGDAPLAIPVLAVSSLVALLWPSIRRYVAPGGPEPGVDRVAAPRH